MRCRLDLMQWRNKHALDHQQIMGLQPYMMQFYTSGFKFSSYRVCIFICETTSNMQKLLVLASMWCRLDPMQWRNKHALNHQQIMRLQPYMMQFYTSGLKFSSCRFCIFNPFDVIYCPSKRISKHKVSSLLHCFSYVQIHPLLKLVIFSPKLTPICSFPTITLA